jgi:GNAT superfamily N-acetyltransferase
MHQIKPLEFCERSLRDYVALFAICFPSAKKYDRQYLHWLYCENPWGNAIGFDMWDGDKLAAHYACIPFQTSVGGVVVKTLLSLNTATHPDYQGKGFFTKLADQTFHTAATQGYDCVYGVANANSTPGFIRKLGFQLVEPLRAMVGIGRSQTVAMRSQENLQFSTAWTPATLKWRCDNPANAVHQRRSDEIVQFHASVGKHLCAYAELPQQVIDSSSAVAERQPSLLRLYLGLFPTGIAGNRCYANIPMSLRPSPLNFIYRSLSGRVPHLNEGEISLSFLDFDAY